MGWDSLLEIKLEKKLSGDNDDKCGVSDKVANNKVRNSYHCIRNSHRQKQ